jgi:DNA-binding MarR family transcriptional regulator
MLDVHVMNAVETRLQKGLSMSSAAQREDRQNAQIVLGLLESVERDGAVSQRRLAAELGIALGLVNAYLKRCIQKGLVKVNEAPARRYAYYLTPHGFAEKSRLTVEYLSSSFSFFRSARADCAEVLQTASARAWTRIALVGVSDLAEISTICALESGVKIVAVVDAAAAMERFIGLPVLASFEALEAPCDAALVTDLKNPAKALALATKHFGSERVLLPALLSGRLRNRRTAP